MITRITLTNFMSHAQTVIDLAPGLTVLVGANNVGKSAVAAALQMLCRNPKSGYVQRHGERECSVEIETDDGHKIEWRRKNAVSYSIDGVVFDRLNRDVPEELHKILRLPMVDEAEIDVHFASQKQPVFLLDSADSQKARFFASSSDAIQFVKMQRRHKEKLAEANRTKGQLEKESQELTKELELLEPAVDLQRRLEECEAAYAQLTQAADWLDHLERTATLLEARSREYVWRAAEVAALTSLASPPLLAPTEPLQQSIASLERTQSNCRSGQARVTALHSLLPPPALADTDSCQRIIESMDRAKSRHGKAARDTKALTSLAAPPVQHGVADMAELVASIGDAELFCSSSAEATQALSSLVAPPAPQETEPLMQLIESLTTRTTSESLARRGKRSLDRLTSPPEIPSGESLEAAIKALAQSTTQQSSLASEVETSGHELEAAAAELRALAERSQCKACGAPLDFDRLVTLAVSPQEAQK